MYVYYGANYDDIYNEEDLAGYKPGFYDPDLDSTFQSDAFERRVKNGKEKEAD